MAQCYKIAQTLYPNTLPNMTPKQEIDYTYSVLRYCISDLCDSMEKAIANARLELMQADKNNHSHATEPEINRAWEHLKKADEILNNRTLARARESLQTAISLIDGERPEISE